MCKSLISRSLAGLCALTLAAPFAAAQVAATKLPTALPTPGPSAAQADRLTNETLRAMLEAEQYEFTVDPQDAGVFEAKVQRGTWTFYVTISLSSSGNYLWLNERLGEIADPNQVPGARLLALLEANHHVQPAQFYYSAPSHGIYLAMSLKNQGITRDDLRQALYLFVDTAVNSEGAWNAAKWELTPAAGTPALVLPTIPAPKNRT